MAHLLPASRPEPDATLERLIQVEAETGPDTADFEALMSAEQKRIFLLCWRVLRDRDQLFEDVFSKVSSPIPGPVGPIRSLFEEQK